MKTYIDKKRLSDIFYTIEQGYECEDIDTSAINTIKDLRFLIDSIEKDADLTIKLLNEILNKRAITLESEGYCSECGGEAEYTTVSKGYVYLDGRSYRDSGGDTVKCFCSECGKEIH